MRPTSPWLLAAAGGVAGVGGGYGFGAAYTSLPALPATWVISVGVVAIALAFLAATTRNRLRGRPGTTRPEALTVARYAALARACSPVGVVVAGLWLGALVWLLVTGAPGSTAGHDRTVTIAGLMTGAALTAAALWLEWVCRVRADRQDPPVRT